MAKERTPGGWRAPADAPSEAHITITPVPLAGGTPLRSHLPRARTCAGLALAVALAAEIGTTGLAGNRAQIRIRARLALQHAPGLAGVALAYGYPLRCLSIAISGSNPAYATARVEREGHCARYRGYVDASFHRIGGAWRLVLDEGQLFVPNSLLGRSGK
jgi:hypothetical protein